MQRFGRRALNLFVANIECLTKAWWPVASGKHLKGTAALVMLSKSCSLQLLILIRRHCSDDASAGQAGGAMERLLLARGSVIERALS